MKPTLIALLGLLSIAGCGPSDGPYVEKYDNGRIKVEGFYKGGKKTGSWTYYWKSGIKQVEGSYKKDEPAGVWKFYDEKGKPIAQGTYRDGKMWEGTFVRYVFGTKKFMSFKEGKEVVK